MKYCKTCSDILELGDNWANSYSLKKYYLCRKCVSIKDKKYRAENKEKIKDYHKKYRVENKTNLKEYHRGYRNKNGLKLKKYLREWGKSNKGIVNSHSAKKRAAKIQRTPSWADLDAIRDFYINCPKGMAVDHILPLQGRLVSGLHIVENLQYLTPSENSKKGNRLPQEM